MGIVLYSKFDCSYCTKAKALLSSKNLSFNEIVVGQDVVREEFISIFPQVKTMPFIIIDGNHVGGYDELKEYFDSQELLLENK